MTVWVVESGDYEQRGIRYIAESFDTAVDVVKAAYGPPYRVAWTVDGQGLTGTFEAVVGYSIAHTARFDITEYAVVRSSPTRNA